MKQKERRPGGSVNAGASREVATSQQLRWETHPHTCAPTATPQVRTVLPGRREAGCVHTAHTWVSAETAFLTDHIWGPAGRWFPRAVPLAMSLRAGSPCSPALWIPSNRAQPTFRPPWTLSLPCWSLLGQSHEWQKGLNGRLCCWTGSHGVSWRDRRCGHGQQMRLRLARALSCLWAAQGAEGF